MPNDLIPVAVRVRSHPSSADPVVIGESLTFQYPGAPTVALQVQQVVIPQGQRLALIGPNGAGKSTLLKAITGLLRPSSGTLQVLGQPAGSCPWRIAYVPQRRDVDWRFPISAREVALMGRDVHLRWPRRPRAQDRAVALAALHKVGMAAHADAHIAALSGGQQQRVFLARALAQQAALLLLDEPFVGVDTATTAIIFRIIDQVCADGGTVVVATHDLTTLTAHFDQVLVLQGQVVAAGSPAEVLQPAVLAAAYGGPLAVLQEQGRL